MLQFLIMNAASNYDFIIFFKTYTKNFTIIKFGPCKNENNHALRIGLWKYQNAWMFNISNHIQKIKDKYFEWQIILLFMHNIQQVFDM